MLCLIINKEDKMIGLIKVVVSFNFLIGALIGAIAMYLLKPLVDAAIQKLINKNS
jgi:hypothetical protein